MKKTVILFIFLISFSSTTFMCCSKNTKTPRITKKVILVEGEEDVKVRKRIFHPSFFITIEEFTSTLESLPVENSVIINQNRMIFLDQIAILLNQPPELTWLVDKQNMIPDAFIYEPRDLTHLSAYPQLTLNNNSLKLRKLIIPDLLAMIKDAQKEDLSLTLSSTYRSYNYQKIVFNRWRRELGIQEASRISARAGTSQHQLGTTMDFGSISKKFAKKPEGIWINENGWKYGFSLSYPKGYEKLTGYDWEPWHFRYIGQIASTMQHDWFSGIQQDLLVWFQANREFFEKNYEEQPLF